MDIRFAATEELDEWIAFAPHMSSLRQAFDACILGINLGNPRDGGVISCPSLMEG